MRRIDFTRSHHQKDDFLGRTSSLLTTIMPFLSILQPGFIVQKARLELGNRVKYFVSLSWPLNFDYFAKNITVILQSILSVSGLSL